MSISHPAPPHHRSWVGIVVPHEAHMAVEAGDHEDVHRQSSEVPGWSPPSFPKICRKDRGGSQTNDETWRKYDKMMQFLKVYAKVRVKAANIRIHQQKLDLDPAKIGLQTPGTWTFRYRNRALSLKQHTWPTIEGIIPRQHHPTVMALNSYKWDYNSYNWGYMSLEAHLELLRVITVGNWTKFK